MFLIRKPYPGSLAVYVFGHELGSRRDEKGVDSLVDRDAQALRLCPSKCSTCHLSHCGVLCHREVLAGLTIVKVDLKPHAFCAEGQQNAQSGNHGLHFAEGWRGVGCFLARSRRRRDPIVTIERFVTHFPPNRDGPEFEPVRQLSIFDTLFDLLWLVQVPLQWQFVHYGKPGPNPRLSSGHDIGGHYTETPAATATANAYARGAIDSLTSRLLHSRLQVRSRSRPLANHPRAWL